MSSSYAALIVDADPKGLEALVYGFQGADWRTTPCPTPETASLLVKASGAAVVVIASRSEHEKAHALIRQIRAKDASRTLPLLVLGPEELRKPLKEGGGVDLLPLPAFVRDVLTASQLLVEAGAAAEQKPGEEPCLAMPIAARTTLSLIRTLCGLSRSGLLQLERKGRRGEILFHEGELTAAQVGQLQGMAAVQHVLVWDEGALKLHLRPVARRGQLHQSVQEFLEDFDRFQRDFTHAMKDIGPPATVYETSEERLQHSANAVPAEVTPVVRLCDGQRSLSDIIDESPFRVLDTVRILGRLVNLAILVRRDPKPDSHAKATRAPLDEFWETAQIVGPVTPRAVRARSESAESTTPPSVALTPPAVQTSAPAVLGESNAHREGKGHTRKKTLEIAPSAASMPAVEAQPAVLEAAKTPSPVAASPATAAVTGAMQGMGATQPITARLPILPATPASAAPTAKSTGETAAAGPEPQPAAAHTPLANLPVTGTMQGIDASQAGTAHSPFAPVPKMAVPGTQASGTIEQRERRSQSALRAVPARTSVVLDIAQLETAQAPDIAVVQTPVVQTPVVQTPVVQNPVAPAPSGASAARITGEFQVAPSRKTARQMPAQTTISIQLDASLAPAPKIAGAPAQEAETPKVAPSPMRLTGEMKIPPSGKIPREAGTPERTSSSFPIDASLTAETPVAASDAGTHASGSQPVGPTPNQRRQSGGFSPIEKDFFEREAELYKVDGAESFADLDEKSAKSGSKSAASKKAGRPYRK
jgi:hypothetical protein